MLGWMTILRCVIQKVRAKKLEVFSTDPTVFPTVFTIYFDFEKLLCLKLEVLDKGRKIVEKCRFNKFRYLVNYPPCVIRKIPKIKLQVFTTVKHLGKCLIFFVALHGILHIVFLLGF
ncbi:MAG: hypothetical protein EOL88_08100 [Bacteroidia bacterium]|nr:hypothetical protein [Bacteroidia bacterium]